MKNSITIHVRVNKGEDSITIIDSAGNEKVLRSVMVIGGGHEENAIYCFTAGSSSDLGWSMGAMWRFCRMSDREEEGHLRKAFNQFMAWCCTFFGIPIHGEIDAKTLLERIESDIIYKEMAEDGTVH